MNQTRQAKGPLAVGQPPHHFRNCIDYWDTTIHVTLKPLSKALLPLKAVKEIVSCIRDTGHVVAEPCNQTAIRK